MALSDWKKRGEGYWINKKTEDTLVIKYYSAFENYDVQLNYDTIASSLKTKEKALAYAKSYMRNN